MVSPYYPNQVPWTDKKDWVSPENPGDLVEADHVNQLYAEVNAIGQDVGTHKPEIGIADKETLDKIDTNVGAKTDAASSTGSLHAKVRDAKNAINAGNSTVNTINTNVGAKADAASATGRAFKQICKNRVGSRKSHILKKGPQRVLLFGQT
jgi:hypothetical protein